MIVIFFGYLLRYLIFFAVLPTSYYFLKSTGILILSLVFAAYTMHMYMTSEFLIEYSSYKLVTFFILEITFGFLLAVPVVLGMYFYELLGRLVDTSRGAQFGDQMLPGTSASVSPLEHLGVFFIPVLLFCFNGFKLLLPLIAKPSVLQSPNLTIGMNVDAHSYISLVGSSLYYAVLFVLPVILFCLMYDLVCAFCSKYLGKVNLIFECMPGKLLLGLVIFVCIIMLQFEELAIYLSSIIAHIAQSQGEI